MSPNMAAFLATIRHSEGTDQKPDPYAVVFGYGHTITDFTDHPAITGEWKGVSIAFLGPQYEGEISTAAGAYQITKGTWLALKFQAQRRGEPLPDFTGPSQDRGAAILIDQKGATEMIEAGNFAAAIEACHRIWASLPGSTSGQPQSSMLALTVTFTDAGGKLA